MSNPIVQREFFGILRTRKALAALVSLSVAFSAIVVLRWPTDGVGDLSGKRAQLVFQVFGYGLTLGVLLLIPAFPAVSIVREKNSGTLALLFNSPMKAYSIYFGKLAGVLLFSLLLLVTSVPASVACYAMGGVDLFEGLGLLYATLLITTLQYITLGLLVSTYASSGDGAVRVTYAFVFGLAFLTLGPHYFLQGHEGTFATIASWLREASAVPVVMQIVGHGDVGSQGVFQESRGPIPFFVISAASALGFAFVTMARLNYRLFDRSRDQGVITEDRSWAEQSFRRMAYVVDPQRRKAGIPWYLSPVMVKEFRCRRFGRSHWLIRLVAICAVVSLLLTLGATTGTMDWGVETIGGIMVLLQVSLILLITPSLAAGLISGERESGGWELLRMTPLTGFAILRGKLLSVVWTLLLVLSATLPGYLVMIYIKPDLWLQIYLVLISLLLASLLTLMLSIAISSFFSRTATATTAAYVALMVVFLGPLLVWLGRDAPFGHRFVETMLRLNPMGAAMNAIEVQGFTQYQLLPSSWWVAGLLSASLAVAMSFQIWRLMRPT